MKQKKTKVFETLDNEIFENYEELAEFFDNETNFNDSEDWQQETEDFLDSQFGELEDW
jgi:predicted ATP-binding protein involved in virulence